MNDLIDRQAAIRTAHLPTIADAGYEVIRLDDVLAIPVAPAVQQWVPCSERLPENRDKVLVTDMWWGPQIEIARYVDGKFYEGPEEIDVTSTVTAWMPLPEPHCEGRR